MQGLLPKRALNNKPKIPSPDEAKPKPDKQRNFTDPESRIMLNSTTKSFEQCYNAQIAVDGHAQIILASAVTQDVNDKNQLVPMAELTQRNVNAKPEVLSADNGFYSEDNIRHPLLASIELLVAVGKDGKKDEKGMINKPRRGLLPKVSHAHALKVGQRTEVREQMAAKLRTKRGKELSIQMAKSNS